MPRRSFRAIRAACLASLAALAACRSAGAAAEPVRDPAFACRDDGVPGIPNYAVIADGLARGGQPTAEGLAYLAQQGVRTIVNLREQHSERREAEALGMCAVEIPMRANVLDSRAPTDAQVREFFDVVLDPARRPVFFHCKHGKDRTGMMAALYRIEVDGWTNERAIEEMQAFGYHDVFHDLIAYVRAYRPRGAQ